LPVKAASTVNDCTLMLVCIMAAKWGGKVPILVIDFLDGGVKGLTIFFEFEIKGYVIDTGTDIVDVADWYANVIGQSSLRGSRSCATNPNEGKRQTVASMNRAIATWQQ
jgi:hypothetical protein